MLCVLSILVGGFILAKLLRRGCRGGGHWRRRGRFGGRRHGGGPLGHLRDALDTTPEQEEVILAAWRELRDTGRGARGEWKASRKDVAEAFAADSLDAERLGHTFARHDEVIETLRKAVVGALAKVHDVLDERQRARLAQILADGPRGFGFDLGGPYR